MMIPEKNNLAGQADDESGAQGPTVPPAAVPANLTGTSSSQQTATAKDITNSPNRTNTDNSESASWVNPECEEYNPNVASNLLPGRRLKNPLGYLASYTYQISLYVITPDAYDAFVASGRKNINTLVQAANASDFAERARAQQAAGEINSNTITGGAYLVAQSGGIGVTNGEARAPGFDYDLYIDNLNFKHIFPTNGTGSSISDIEINFKITEPYGFSFITNLNRVKNEIINYSGGKSNISSNPTKMFFILGLRFFGWDQAGRQVKGTDYYDGAQLDPNSTGESLFETFYDIVFTEVRFKLDGKATVYSIKAAPVSTNLSINVRKGMNTTVKEASGKTVHDILCGESGFITKLNLEESKKADASKTGQKPMKYKIKWLGDANEIAFASVKSDADVSKGVTPGSSAWNTMMSNDATAVTSQPKTDMKKITFGDNQPIVQLIENVIMVSSYMEDAMKVIQTDSTENDSKTKTAPEVKPSRTKAVKWFNISPEISDVSWDTSIKDWVFTITYAIQTYYIPIVDSPMVDKTTKYYGPHKRYDYWYTGKNSEIISYESTLNNNYFTVALKNQPDSKPSDAPGNANGNQTTGGAVATGQQSNQLEGGGGGHRTDSVSNFRTNLYDPGAYAEATVQILGDPDFLMQPVTNGVNGVFNKFYQSDTYTVNPCGGQVFFEIDFKEAVDYSTSTVESVNGAGKGVTGVGGTLSINDSILFWNDTPEYIPDPVTGKATVQGISYRMRQVDTTLVNGGFKQTLHAFINTFNAPKAESDENREPETDQSQSQTPAGAGTAPASPNAEKQPVPSASGSAGQAKPDNKQVTSPTGNNGKPVADGDASKNG